ncbi:MAG TPA: transposase, partial [Dissulfurispiraceae bacterium]|nr:transposase [Dissulfurispiraceae bacterium]
DAERNKTLVFLTNNFKLAASTIAQIYKSRWQIELFFKWIKQNLKIKSFLGTSKNAVLTQVWVAMSYYLLLSYIKYQTRYGHSLLQLSRVIRETLFERKTLIDILTLRSDRLLAAHEHGLQGALF